MYSGALVLTIVFIEKVDGHFMLTGLPNLTMLLNAALLRIFSGTPSSVNKVINTSFSSCYNVSALCAVANFIIVY